MMERFIGKCKCCLYLIKLDIKNSLVYKKRTVSQIIQLLFSLYASVYVWKALQSINIANSISLEALITYSVVSTLLSATLPQNCVSSMFTNDINSGNVGLKVIRPISLEAFAISKAIGYSIGSFITKGIPILVISILLYNMHIEFTWVTLLMFIFCYLCAYILFILIDFIAAYTCFWIIKGSSVQHFFEALFTAFSGKIIPVILLPSWFIAIANCLPMVLVYQTEISILTGLTPTTEYVYILVQYLMWIIFTLFIAKIMQTFAYRKIFIQGG